MDVTLREHGAKHVYRIPEGLRELCSDISREVLRSQPQDIYSYIGAYVEALLITRENARVAVRVVKNILLGSEAIVGILNGTGLSLGQIAVAAPRLQKAFRAYLDTVDVQPVRVCEARSLDDEKSRTSVRHILESIGACSDKAEKAATLIQAAFRGHYERMLEREANGDIVLERAAKSTTDILKRAGVSQNEAEEAATLIQSAYRGYYTRRNMKPSRAEDERKPDLESYLPESRKTIQAVAWLDMMYEDSGINARRANDAATLIQSSYRGYRARKRFNDVKTRSSLVIDEIVDSTRNGIIERLPKSRDNIPREFENEKEAAEGLAEKIETAREERFEESRFSTKTDDSDEINDNFAENYEEIQSRDGSISKETKLSDESMDNFTKKIRNEDTKMQSHRDSKHDNEK